MSGDFSREAFAAQLGPELMNHIIAEAGAAPAPSSALVDRVRRIFAPAVTRLAERDRVPDMADAA